MNKAHLTNGYFQIELFHVKTGEEWHHQKEYTNSNHYLEWCDVFIIDVASSGEKKAIKIKVEQFYEWIDLIKWWMSSFDMNTEVLTHFV